MYATEKSRKVFVRVTIIAIVTIMMSQVGLLAQTTGSGTINGTIKDPVGAVIPGAALTIHNQETGIERQVLSNHVGIYSAPFLQPGRYEITADKAGFANAVVRDLTLEVGQVATLNLTLSIQAATTELTVSVALPLLDTDKTEMSQVITQTQKENLPLAGRRWETFALLTPNTTTDGGNGLVSYRGISGLYNSSAVDGTNNNQAFFSESKGRTGVPYVYSMDSIREFQVTSSNYSAELGQAAGGVINAVTKSGGNGVHGDLFYYLRHPNLNALDSINKSKGINVQPVRQQHQFGGSVSGPLQKDKLFYFLTYDGSRRISPISYVSFATFPLSCPAALSAVQCTAANQFFQSQLGSVPKNANQDVGFSKLDYQVNPNNRLSGSFNMNNFRSPNSYGTSTTNNNSSPTQSGYSVTHGRILVASWDSTLSSSMIDTQRFQWSRDLEVASANSPGPSVSVANVMGYGMPNALPRPAFPDEHRYQFANVLSINKGRHLLKTGVDVNFIHELLINLFQGGGVYSYSGSSAFNNWVADVTGTSLGDGLTGRHFNTFVQVNDPITGVGKDDFYNNDFAAFFEDSWKVRPGITLNLGVRYDLQLIPAPPKPNTATPLTTLYTSTINIDKNNFSPRLGLAWALAKGTVLRAGYGIFYAKTSNSTYYATRVENGVYQQTFNCTPASCPSLTFPNLIFTPPGGIPTAPFAGALTPQIVPFTPPGNTATTRGQSSDWVNPMVHEGELTVEHELPFRTTVSGSYIFSRALHLPMFIDSNIAPSTTTKTYDVTDASGATTGTVTVPFYTSRIDSTGPVLTGFSDVNSWYHSMVLTMSKRMSRGIEFVTNYTLSNAKDGGQVPGQFGTFNGTDSPIDPYNRKLEYGRSDLDQRHRFSGTLVLAPNARGLSNPLARRLMDGFTFSSIVVVTSGQAVTGTVNGFPSGGPAGGLSGATVNNSGTSLSSSRFPGLDRNTFTGPGVRNVDFRVSRQFALRENVRLILHAEAFNLFNSSNFFTVNTTQYNYTAAGSGNCAGHSNACVVANTPFLSRTASSNGLYGARQIQIVGRLSF